MIQWYGYIVVYFGCNRSVCIPVLPASGFLCVLVSSIFGVQAAGRFEDLFTQHLLMAADWVNAAKNGEADRANLARKNGIKTPMKLPHFYLPSTGAGPKNRQALRRLPILFNGTAVN